MQKTWKFKLCNYNFNPGVWKTIFLIARKHCQDVNVTELYFKKCSILYTLLTLLFPNLIIQPRPHVVCVTIYFIHFIIVHSSLFHTFYHCT